MVSATEPETQDPNTLGFLADLRDACVLEYLLVLTQRSTDEKIKIQAAKGLEAYVRKFHVSLPTSPRP